MAAAAETAAHSSGPKRSGGGDGAPEAFGGASGARARQALRIAETACAKASVLLISPGASRQGTVAVLRLQAPGVPRLARAVKSLPDRACPVPSGGPVQPAKPWPARPPRHRAPPPPP